MLVSGPKQGFSDLEQIWKAYGALDKFKGSLTSRLLQGDAAKEFLLNQDSSLSIFLVQIFMLQGTTFLVLVLRVFGSGVSDLKACSRSDESRRHELDCCNRVFDAQRSKAWCLAAQMISDSCEIWQSASSLMFSGPCMSIAVTTPLKWHEMLTHIY